MKQLLITQLFTPFKKIPYVVSFVLKMFSLDIELPDAPSLNVNIQFWSLTLSFPTTFIDFLKTKFTFEKSPSKLIVSPSFTGESFNAPDDESK